mgnify:CR=1 FL=1
MALEIREVPTASYGFIAACEQRLDIGAAPPSLGIERRLKAPLLRSNLRALGCSAPAIDRIAFCEQLPHVERWPAALGYFYVIEGSTLGGQLLARHFRERLGAGDEALAFLLGSIGIVAVMLISIRGRTREIGLRLAVGARREQVLMQFLLEAAFLSGIGGVAGIAVAPAALVPAAWIALRLGAAVAALGWVVMMTPPLRLVHALAQQPFKIRPHDHDAPELVAAERDADR